MIFLSKIKKLKKNESIINGSLFSLFSFVNRGFSFLLLLILANYIAPAEYGYLSLFGTVVMVIGYFIALSTEGYLSVSFFRDGQNGITQTFSCVLFTSLIIATFFYLLLFFFGDDIAIKLDLPQHCLFFAVGISFLTVYSHLILNYFRLQKKVRIYGFFSCGNACLNFILSILLVKTFLFGWEGRVYAQLSCCCIFGLIGLFFFIKKRFVSLPNKKHWKMMLLWGIPLIPHLATTFIRQGCDRYIVNYYHTIEDVGLFSFALNLANIIIMVGIGFNQSNSVDIYSILGNQNMTTEEKKKLIKVRRMNIFLIYLVCSAFITIGCFIAIPFVLPKYSMAMKYFPILALYAFINCLYFLYTNFLFYYKKTKNLMYITFGASLSHLMLSLCLTQYSLYYTCMVYLISQVLIVLLVRRNVNKLFEE